MSPSLLRLHPADNVLVARRLIAAGESLDLGLVSAKAPQAILLGHKVAARAIRAGEKIVKYGVPIGSATQDIAAGDHVHLHNLRSDYLPTRTWDPTPAPHDL